MLTYIDRLNRQKWSQTNIHQVGPLPTQNRALGTLTEDNMSMQDRLRNVGGVAEPPLNLSTASIRPYGRALQTKGRGYDPLAVKDPGVPMITRAGVPLPIAGGVPKELGSKMNTHTIPFSGVAASPTGGMTAAGVLIATGTSFIGAYISTWLGSWLFKVPKPYRHQAALGTAVLAGGASALFALLQLAKLATKADEPEIKQDLGLWDPRKFGQTVPQPTWQNRGMPRVGPPSFIPGSGV